MELGRGIHTPDDLHSVALKLEELAGAEGSDPALADRAWARAINTAERNGEVLLKEQLTKAYVQALLRRDERKE
jgi:hypothetical protein